MRIIFPSLLCLHGFVIKYEKNNDISHSNGDYSHYYEYDNPDLIDIDEYDQIYNQGESYALHKWGMYEKGNDINL